MTDRKICPMCKSKETIKNGKRKTLNRGLIQRYKCNECKKKFVLDDGFYRMRNNQQKITLCIDLFFKGVSTRQIQEHLQQFYPKNSSWVSVYNWVLKYSKRISQFTNTLNLKSGKEVQIDEMEIGKRSSRYSGWFIDSIDTETRFMVSSEFTKKRDLEEIKGVLNLVKKKTQAQVEIVTSDGWLAYPKAIKKVFGYNNKLGKHNVIHNQVNASRGEGFNHKIERLHNSIRQRIKTMRGFHGSVESANTLLKGYEIYYNFIRKHQAIKCCPYELATNLKLNGNKWLELINLSQ